MLLARTRYWQVSFVKGAEMLSITLLRDALGEDLRELRDPRIEVPLARWNRVVKYIHTDRKLLGGILLDFARSKECVAATIGHDGLFSELQRSVVQATLALVETGALALTAVDVGADGTLGAGRARRARGG